MFNEATLTDDREVSQLEHELPGAVSGPLIPTEYWDSDHKLALWRLEAWPAS